MMVRFQDFQGNPSKYSKIVQKHVILEDFGEKSRFLKKKQEFSTSCPSHIVTFFSELSRSASVKFLSVNFFIRNQLLRNFIADTFITLCMGGLSCDKQQRSKYTVYTVYTDVHSNMQGKYIIAPCSKPGNNF